MDTADDWDIQIGDLKTSQMRKIKEAIASISVSYSISLVTQLSITFIDTNMDMLENNYFIVGRDLIYRTKSLIRSINDFSTRELTVDGYYIQTMEIASVAIGPGSGSSVMVTVEARTKAHQQMKRDKKPPTAVGSSSSTTSYSYGVSGSGINYIINAAKKYGLKAVVEQGSNTKSISSGSGNNGQDSLWDVLNNMASNAKCNLFESDGILYFASLKHLLGKWGSVPVGPVSIQDPKTNKVTSQMMNTIPLIWPPTHYDIRYPENAAKEAIILMALPSMSKSDNDPYVIEGSASVDRYSGMSIRPGMTVNTVGIPTFEDFFVVTEVSFEHLSNNPVSITFKKPEREAKNIRQYDVGPIFSSLARTKPGSEIDFLEEMPDTGIYFGNID